MLNQNPSTFTWNGRSSDEFGIRIERKPDLSRSARKFKSASVNGRNGNIYQLQDAWEEVVVAYDIFAGGTEKGDAITDFTAIMEWLNSADDYAVLTDSYDPSHYRLAVFVDAVDIASEWYTIGQATVKFRCRPQRFIVTDPIEVEDGDTITNSTNHVAKPIITLTGAGQVSMFEVEKPLLDVEYSPVGGYGQPIPSTLKTQMLADMFWIASNYLIHYDVQIYKSSTAGTVSIQSNTSGRIKFHPTLSNYGLGAMMPVNTETDYVISYTATPSDSNEYEMYISYVNNNDTITKTMYHSYTGTQTISFTFKTDSDTAYVIIAFYFVSGGSRTLDITDLMLVKGTTAQPFRAYTTAQIDTFTVGDTTMQITSQGFDDAVIDCERENLSMDGSDSNINATVLDQYGNLSVNYLALQEGSNEVTFTNGITAVSVEPRFWEL